MSDPRVLTVDGADMWPRYYFYYLCAHLEILAWLRERGEYIEGSDLQEKTVER